MNCGKFYLYAKGNPHNLKSFAKALQPCEVEVVVEDAQGYDLVLLANANEETYKQIELQRKICDVEVQKFNKRVKC